MGVAKVAWGITSIKYARLSMHYLIKKLYFFLLWRDKNVYQETLNNLSKGEFDFIQADKNHENKCTKVQFTK